MKLTKAQAKAVRNDDNSIVVACPGSGKTRCLIAKLLRCIDIVRDSPRKIACITYTNAAVYEIEHRLRKYGATGDEEYCDISTIHAFCLNNILRFFHWRLPGFERGFKVLPPDSEPYMDIVREVCNDHGLDSKAHESFQLLNREPDSTPITPYPLTEEVASDFWHRIEREHYIDFPNIVYLSFKLISEFSSIAHAIACRFAWILVDEFQDTSALQVEILKAIAAKRHSKFFLVGDPYQSIFGFAGARPDLMDDFANRIQARGGFKLLGNFRSSRPIINHAERLCPRDPPMFPSGSASQYTEKPLYIHSENSFDAITDYFLPALEDLGIDYGQSAILGPWWIKLLHLGRKLRDYGIPIVGPGARPYKRSHEFAFLAEQICQYIEHPSPQFITRIERELFLLINKLTGKTNLTVYSYNGRRTVFKLVRIGKALREESESGTSWLISAGQEFANALCEEEFLPRSCEALLSESAKQMIEDMIKNGIDVSNLSVSDLGMFASSEKNMKLLTMHRAKGREFDAVALVDLHEGRIPHFSSKTIHEIAEAQRQLYVAMTRAKRLLMYITDSESWKNRPSRFLLEEGLELKPISI